jgi:hypothetical protein
VNMLAELRRLLLSLDLVCDGVRFKGGAVLGNRWSKFAPGAVPTRLRFIKRFKFWSGSAPVSPGAAVRRGGSRLAQEAFQRRHQAGYFIRALLDHRKVEELGAYASVDSIPIRRHAARPACQGDQPRFRYIVAIIRGGLEHMEASTTSKSLRPWRGKRA